MPPNTTYSEETYTRNRKFLLLFSIVAIIVIAISAIVLTIINSQKSATIQIIVAPTTATVKIDGHQFKTEDTVHYYPGNFTAEISATGFTSQTLDLELVADQEAHLYIALEPTADNADYYEQHLIDANRRQAVYDASYQLGSDEYATKYPIVTILPYSYSAEDQFGDPIGYRIDYGKFDNCISDFCLQITGYLKSNLEEAKNYIKSKGFNPDDYQILFNYTPIEKAKPEDFPESIRKMMEDAGYFNS